MVHDHQSDTENEKSDELSAFFLGRGGAQVDGSLLATRRPDEIEKRLESVKNISVK
jgi:hypothetical protein